MMEPQKYKSNRHVVYSCKYHIVWCPKYRRTDQDHIHILAEIDPQFGVNKFVRIVKGKTSRLLREEFAHLKKRLPTLWSNSYFVATVGGAPLAIIKQYIEHQQVSESKKSKQRWQDFLGNGNEVAKQV